MAFEPIQTKKFLNSTGVGHLWEKIRERYDSKLDELVAANESMTITNGNTVQVNVSAEEGNLLQLKTTGDTGLYVSVPAADTYSITKDNDSGDYAAVYHLKKYVSGTGTGVDVGMSINIPKDMVVQSGYVVNKATDGVWGEPGTYIEITLANANNSKLYIPVGSLIEYVTSGSQQGDMVYVTVDPDTHQVTAAITDGTITRAKLSQELQNAIDSAGGGTINSITTGFTNGTINVDGTDVAVYGLGTAAYKSENAFDPAGAAADVLGTNTDTAATMTVYGVKQYASDVYTAIQSLTNTEIDGAIAMANSEIDG